MEVHMANMGDIARFDLWEKVMRPKNEDVEVDVSEAMIPSTVVESELKSYYQGRPESKTKRSIDAGRDVDAILRRHQKQPK